MRQLTPHKYNWRTKKTLGDIWKTAEFFSQIDLCLLKEDPIIS